LLERFEVVEQCRRLFHERVLLSERSFLVSSLVVEVFLVDRDLARHNITRAQRCITCSRITSLSRRGVARGVRWVRAAPGGTCQGRQTGENCFFLNHVTIQIVISYVFACNKNKALWLQRVPILSILDYNIGSLAASGSTLLVLRQFCVGAGLYRIRSFS